MSVIDMGGNSERIVSLRFDNQDFERNASTSLGTLEKLRSSIDFLGHLKNGEGLDSLGKAAASVDMSGMENSVGRIADRFTNLGIVGVTALQNITNKAVDAGTNLVKSLTVKPIKMGFDEYELKMNSVRTIMASTGESIGTVNKYLEELNKYADDTIYSFSDMTSNIGKFTNAGVKLEDAVAAIKGISNEAAISGANANEASRAMYNFSQALSAGYVKLIDWKSIENANMATKQFKEQLLETAVAVGTVVKKGKDYQSTTKDNKGNVSQLFNATKGFNEALQSQWMTTEVLTRTLRNYSTDVSDMKDEEKKAYEQKLKSEGYNRKQIASIMELGKKATDAAREVTTWSKMVDALQEAVQSGWSRTFEILFGDLNEAKKLWTGINDVVSGFIGKIDDARNGLLLAWKDAGGRKALLDGIANVLKYIGSLLQPIGDAFRKVFPPASGEALANATKKFEDFSSTLKASDETLANIEDAFTGFFSVIKLAKDTFTDLVGAVLPAGKSLGSFGEIITSVAGYVGRLVTSLVELIKQSKIIEGTVATIGGVIKAIIGMFSDLAKGVQDFFMPDDRGNKTMLDQLLGDVDKTQKSASKMKSQTETFKNFQDALSSFGSTTLSKKLESFRGQFENIFGISDSSSLIKGIAGILKIVGVIWLAKKAFDKLSSLKNAFNKTKGVASSMGDGFKAIGNSLVETSIVMKSTSRNIQAQTFMTIAKAISMIATAVVVVAKIKKEDLTKSMIVIGLISGVLIALFTLVSKAEFSIKTSGAMLAMAAGFLSIGASMVLIATAAKILAAIKPLDLIKAGVAMAAFIIGIGNISKTSKSAMVGALQFAVIATALGTGLTLLVPTILILSRLSIESLAKAALAISAFILTISKTASAITKNKSGLAIIQFVLISTAVAALTPAITALSQLPFAGALRAAAAIGLVIMSIGYSARAISKDRIAIVSFLAVSVAISILTPAMLALATMPVTQALKATVVLSSVMLSLAATMRIISGKGSKGSFRNGVMLLALAVAIQSISNALLILAAIPFGSIVKAVVGLNAAMISLAYTSRIATGSKKNMLVMAIVLSILASAVKKIGMMDPTKAIVNMAGLSTLMISVGVLTKGLSKITLKGAIAALGKFLVFVTGITLISAALGKVAKEFDGFEAALKKGAKLGTYIGEFVGNIIGGVLSGISNGFIKLAENLSLFMKKLKPFFTGASELDTDAVESVKNLAKAILYITAADLLNQLNSTPLNIFKGGGMVSFAEDLGKFVKALIPIGESAAKVPHVKKLGLVGDAMASLGEAAQKVPSRGGLRGVIFGVNDLGGFAKKLNKFIKVVSKLKEDGLKIGKGDIKNINRVSNVIESLGEASKHVPESISIKGILLGVKDVSAFAGQLKNAAPKLSSFFAAVKKSKGITKGSTAEAARVATAVGALARAASKIPREIDKRSISAFINGRKDLGQFASGMSEMADKIPTLIKKSEGLDQKATARILRMAKIIKSMAEAAVAIKEITNDRMPTGKATRAMIDKLSTFTKKMKDYVPGFKSFADEAMTVGKKQMKAASVVAKIIHNVTDAASVLNKRKGSLSGKDFKELITGIGGGIKKYLEAITTFKTSTVTKRTESLVASISDVSKVLNKKGDYKKAAITSVKAYVDALKDKDNIENAKTNAQDIRSAVTKKLRAIEVFKRAGITVIDMYEEGLQNKEKIKALKETAGELASAVRKKFSAESFRRAGINAALGFAAGLRDKDAVADVMSAGSELGTAAYNAARKALDEKSPSKKMAEVGRFAVRGMTNGLREYSDEVYKEAYTVGEKGLKGAGKGISGIDDILGNPTITPVVDLTNVEQGASRIDSLLGKSARINGAFVDSAINRQNGGKTEQMIRDLGTMLKNTQQTGTGTVYNIGDVTLDVTKLENATTLEDIVTVFRRAKAMV